MRALGLAAAGAMWLGGAAAAVAGATWPPPCRTLLYYSDPGLRAQRACMNTGVRTHGTEPGTYLFLTPGGDVGDGVGIYRDNGTLVWWHYFATERDHDASVLRIHGRPYLAVFTGHAAALGPYDTGSVSLYNEHYQKVGRITSGPPFAGDRVDLHEFRLTPQGNALIGITDPVKRVIDGRTETVIQYVVQELSLVQNARGIHTGRVLFQWDSLKHVPVSASYAGNPGPGGVWDYFHGNSIAQDTDGNLIISARNTWAVYKVSARTGRIIWQVGGKGDHTLAKPWCYQHDATPLGHNEYSLFDDGGSGPHCQTGRTGHSARGLIIRVDPSQHPAAVELIHAYRHDPPLHPEVAGSVQRESDGDALVDWGWTPELTEYSAGGRVKMDLSLSQWSYRGERFAWDGQPRTPPSAAAVRTAGGTRLWASWNGSTEVARWRVLLGTSAGKLRPLPKTISKAGFETAIFIRQHAPVVAVQALGPGGRILATSKVVRTPAGREGPIAASSR